MSGHDSKRIRLSNGLFSSVGILALLLAFSVITPCVASNGSGSLDILLTNDDGWDAVGIQTLKEALEAAGHNVTLVAPDSNLSGSSTSVTFDLITVTQHDSNEYHADATPATCVFLGLTAILEEPPDLVVSGTNWGSNAGLFTPMSGTVGAATAAILSGVPSMAVSTAVADGMDPEIHFQNVAEFAVRLIGHLQSKPGSLAAADGLLPAGVGLKVGYPPLAPEDVKGVKLSVQGKGAPATLVYIEIAPGLFIPHGDPPPEVEEVKDADITGLQDGFITIVPIDGDYPAGPQDLNKLQSVVNGLSP